MVFAIWSLPRRPTPILMLNPTAANLKIQGSESLVVGLLNSKLPNDNNIASASIGFEDGTGMGKAQKVGSMSTLLLAGASYLFDLRNFTGLGANVVFAKAKIIVLVNQGIFEGDTLVWGDDGTVTNPFTAIFQGTSPRIVLPCNGFDAKATGSAAGWTVDATHRILKVTNTGTNSVNAGVTVVGEV